MDEIYTFIEYQTDLESCVKGTPYASEASSLSSEGPKSVYCTIRYTRESNNLESETELKQKIKI